MSVASFGTHTISVQFLVHLGCSLQKTDLLLGRVVVPVHAPERGGMIKVGSQEYNNLQKYFIRFGASFMGTGFGDRYRVYLWYGYNTVNIQGKEMWCCMWDLNVHAYGALWQNKADP